MTTRPERAGRRPVVAGVLLAACVLAVWVLGGGDTADDPGGRRAIGAPQRPAPAGENGTDSASRNAAQNIPERGSPSTRAGGATPSARPGRPRVIAIPAIGVRAPVVPIKSTGRVLVPPQDPTKVGWWSEGARPGARTGSAVLAGHTVSTGGGVFDRLDRVQRGDRIRVTTSRGVLRYVVEDVVAYRKRSLPDHARALFSQSVPGRLVLVTCENWNGEVHLSNQIVVALPG